VPATAMRSARLIDGALWTGENPELFAARQEIHA
jgi:hypothetical protein